MSKFTSPLPLAGRATMGAMVGALIARQEDQDVLLAAVLGAATALIVAHLAYQARQRLRLPGVASGLVEDSLVITVASRYA